MRQCDTAFSEGWGQIVTPLSVPTASGKKQITPQNNSHFRSRSKFLTLDEDLFFSDFARRFRKRLYGLFPFPSPHWRRVRDEVGDAIV